MRARLHPPERNAHDILAADLATSPTDLTVHIRVANLASAGADPTFGGDGNGTMHSFSFRIGGVAVSGHTMRSFDHAKQSSALSVGGIPVVDHRPTATYDHATHTVSLAVPVAGINEGLARTCTSCTPFGSGTVLTGITVGSSFGPYVHEEPVGMILYAAVSGDEAATSDSYTVS